MPNNILITGLPGVGKTTLIKHVYAWAKDEKDLAVKGFYTGEIREHGRRKGFEIATTDDRQSILAHVDISSPYRVSKYGVNIREFKETVLPLFEEARNGGVLYLIDEIGKMELFSDKFVEAVKKVLGAPDPLVATIAQKGGGFIQEIKRRPDVKLFTLTFQNRDTMFETMKEVISEIVEKDSI